jgi:hypothetical protein
MSLNLLTYIEGNYTKKMGWFLTYKEMVIYSKNVNSKEFELLIRT